MLILILPGRAAPPSDRATWHRCAPPLLLCLRSTCISLAYFLYSKGGAPSTAATLRSFTRRRAHRLCTVPMLCRSSVNTTWRATRPAAQKTVGEIENDRSRRHAGAQRADPSFEARAAGTTDRGRPDPSAAVGGPGSGCVTAAGPATASSWELFRASLRLQLSQPRVTLRRSCANRCGSVQRRCGS